MFVTLREFNRLLIFFVSSEDQSRNSSEFFIVMSFNLLGKSKSINALEISNRLSKSIEIFNLKIERVQSVIDSLIVLALDTLEPFNDDWKISSLFHLNWVKKGLNV